MSIAGLKITLKSYLGFNYAYTGGIALLVFGILYFLICKKNGMQRRNISKSEIKWVAIFSIYIALLIGGTMLNRKIGDEHKAELMLFWSYRQFILEKNLALLGQMVYNVLVFIPWPILFGKTFSTTKKLQWGVRGAFIFSLLIETIQLVFKLGLFEFDDIFHNTLGAMIGYFLWKYYRQYNQKGVDE